MEDRHRDWDFEIPRELYDGEEKKLKKRVIHFRKGVRRIFVFTIVGFIMGWFSYLYVTMRFLPLKAVVGVPYKLNEVIHNLLHGGQRMQTTLDAFFPNANYVSVFAENILPVLFGGAIYGSLAYFTGDRKVFTYKRFVKFFSVWVMILAVSIGGTFAGNAYVCNKNESLKDITGFMVHSDLVGESAFAGKNVKKDVNQAIGSYLEQAFYKEGGNLEKLDQSVREKSGEQLLCLWFGKAQSGYMECQVNAEKRYIVTGQGNVFRITEDFAKMLQKFDRETGYNRYYMRYEEEGEMITYEEMAD